MNRLLVKATVAGVGLLTNFYSASGMLTQREVGGPVYTFGYDGHGSTRFLMIGSAVVNVFAYDVYGMLISGSSTPPTAYLYCGEQFDTHLGFYYLRARYLNPALGRFLTMDSYEGNNQDPLSLHKYLFAHCDPVNMMDPSGHWSTTHTIATVGIIATVAAITLPSITHVEKPGFGQSMIPIVGSIWNAAYEFQEGNYGWTAFNVAMAATDIFLVRTVAKAGANVTARLGQAGAASLKPLLASGGQWVSRPGGLRLLDAGSHFVKTVDPAATGVRKWFAETLLEAQGRALQDLGDMAPRFFYSEGKLVIENAGKFTGGAVEFLKARAKASLRIGVFNDVVPRNMGAAGQIFDPALHPFHVMADAAAAYLLARTLQQGLEVYDE